MMRHLTDTRHPEQPVDYSFPDRDSAIYIPDI